MGGGAALNFSFLEGSTMGLCVCVLVCVCMCERVRACVCVCVCEKAQPCLSGGRKLRFVNQTFQYPISHEDCVREHQTIALL